MKTITDNFNDIIKKQVEEVESLTELLEKNRTENQILQKEIEFMTRLLAKSKEENRILQKERRKLEAEISFNVGTTRLSALIDLLKGDVCYDVYIDGGSRFSFNSYMYKVKQVMAVGDRIAITVEEL